MGGKARAIGVSHYCQQHIDDVLEIATVPIAINQQEWHVGMGPDPQGVRSYGEKHGITFQSFSPLCGPCGDVLDKELISGDLVTVIAKTDKLDHLKENLDLFRFKFSAEDLRALNGAASPPSVETVAADCKIGSSIVV